MLMGLLIAVMLLLLLSDAILRGDLNDWHLRVNEESWVGETQTKRGR